MHSSILFTSVLAASALALPQGQLEKRQQVTVTSTVTVTVFVNPFATPAWAGPPRIPVTPNTLRPTNLPSVPVWSAPRVDASRTSTQRPVNTIPPTTSSFRPVVPSTLRPVIPSTSSVRVPLPTTTTRPGLPLSSTGAAGNPSSTVIGPPISGTPGTSSAAPPTASGAPLDPGHTPGAIQASLSVASGLAYRNSILYHHNAARANHNAPPLVWNDTVALTAKITADTCIFEHSVPNGVRQGQNLFTVSGDFFNVTAAITESWYKEEFPYMQGLWGLPSIPSNLFSNVGHLTQVLWKGTTSVGCYSLDCGNRMVVNGQAASRLNKYTVCNYWPAGNVGTLFAINVGLPISNTALGSWTD